MLKRLSLYSGNALKYAVAALILAVPLYPKFPFISVPGTYVSIRLEDFILLSTAVLLFFRVLPNLISVFKDKINRTIFLFLAIGLLSVGSGILLTNTVIPHIGLLHWARRVEYLMCFFIGVYSVRNREDLIFYIKCFIIVIFFAFIYGVGQKYWSWPVITTQNYEYAKGVALRFMPGGHLVSTFAGHYDLATFLVLLMPLFILLLTAKDKFLQSFKFGKNILWMRLILVITVLSGVWLLAQTASRISVAAYFMTVTIALFIARKFIFIPIVLIVSILFMSTSSNLMNRYIQVFEVYVQKVISVQSIELVGSALAQTLESNDTTTRRARDTTPPPASVEVFEDRSTSIRLNVEWPRAIRALQKNPLLGTGFSSITLATDNDYLRMLGEAGVLGFLAFSLIFYKIGLLFLSRFKLIFENNFESLVFIATISALPGIFLNAVFIDIFEASKFAIIFWLIMGITVAVVKNYKHDQQTN